MRNIPEFVKSKYSQAVFLDRDGTINVDTHYPHKIEDLVLIPEAVEGLKFLSTLPVHIIVVSNQAGIALGMYDIKQLTLFNTKLREMVEQEGGRIDAFYFCPHLEAKNMLDNKSRCQCSKPLPGLLIEAGNDYAIDLKNSFMVGDKRSDVLAGENAGCKASILVRTGKSGQDTEITITPQYVVDNLLQASRLIATMLSDISK